MEKNIRRIILASEYAGNGLPRSADWIDSKLSGPDRAAILQVIEAVQGGMRENFTTPGAPGFVIPAQARVEELWQECLRKGEVVQVASFMGHCTASRQFEVKSDRAVTLVHLYTAIAMDQTFRTCDNCGATFAAGAKVTNAFCSEKCRARQADILRREKRKVAAND